MRQLKEPTIYVPMSQNQKPCTKICRNNYQKFPNSLRTINPLVKEAQQPRRNIKKIAQHPIIITLFKTSGKKKHQRKTLPQRNKLFTK